ncbi:MAG: uncharacterized protein A8A55_0765 [Amphiamblys sp. WSBS2006]|nr:MAG: uncharacterized protein A8A55_0765 [Amphiamblys sp. WSBS2006]
MDRTLAVVLQEAEKILDTDSPSMIVSRTLYNLSERTEASEAHKTRIEHVAFSWCLVRHLGHGMMNYRKTSFEGVCRAKLKTSIKIPQSHKNAYPERPVISENRHTDSLTAKEQEEIEFEMGVKTGLEIALESNTAIFPVFERIEKRLYVGPVEYSEYYAGLLHGLGVKGNLCNFPSSFVFELMQQQKKGTTCSLLIGLGVGNLSSGNTSLAKTMKLHLPVFDKEMHVAEEIGAEIPRTVDFQIASLVGLSLVYFQRPDFGFGNGMMRMFRHDAAPQKKGEAFCLALGLSLGFSFLGSGREESILLSSLNMEEELIELANSRLLDTEEQRGQERTNALPCAALLALGLVYMKSDKKYIADSVLPPTCNESLFREKSEIHFYKTLCRGLILWSDISPDKRWVEKNIPEIVKEGVYEKEQKSREGGPGENSACHVKCLAYLNVLRGLSLCVALKYAGRCTEKTRDFFNEIALRAHVAGRKCIDRKNAFEGIIRWNVENTIVFSRLCLAVCFAGSGDLKLFQELRGRHHFREAQAPFQSISMESLSLGFLFLGRCSFTITTKTDKSIALLLASLLPLFPSRVGGCGRYFKRLRYMWAAVVEKKHPQEARSKRTLTDEKFTKLVRLVEEEICAPLL